MVKIMWTEEMKAYVRKNYLLKSRKDMALHLNFSGDTVKRFMVSEKLTVTREVSIGFKVAKMTGKTTFTAAEDEIIKRDYLVKTLSELARELKRSDTGIARSIKRLGLVIPAAVKQQRIADSRIKTGNTPFNKGLKQEDWMPSEMIEATKNTRFKKGSVPPNKRGEMVITIRTHKGIPYKWLHRIGHKVIELHRYNYERFIGQIPDSGIVTFKDGDTMNCCPFNLVLITRSDNAIRNSCTITLKDKAVAMYMATTSRKIDNELMRELIKHPDLIELKRNELLLNRAIKQAAK